MRYQAALRPDICCFLDSKLLSNLSAIPILLPSAQTVSNPGQLGLPVSKLLPSSLAWRLIFKSALRSMCNFIWEYFLNTLAVTLAQEPPDPLVCDAASRKPGCVC